MRTDTFTHISVLTLVIYVTLVPFYYVKAHIASTNIGLLIKYFPTMLVVFCSCLNTAIVVESIKTRQNLFFSIPLLILFVLSNFSIWANEVISLEALSRTTYYLLTGPWLVILTFSLSERALIRYFVVPVVILGFLGAVYGLCMHFSFLYLPPHVYEYNNTDLLIRFEGSPFKGYYQDVRITGFIGNPIVFACSQSVALILFRGILPTYSNLFSPLAQKIISLLYYSIVFISIVLTFSRGQIFALAICFTLMLLFEKKHVPSGIIRYAFSLRYSLLMIFIALSLAALCIIQTTEVTQREVWAANFIQKIESKTQEIASLTGSVEYRINRWKYASEIFLENPFWGIGSGRLVGNLEKYVSEYDGAVNALDNQYLHILCEIGLLGFAAFMGLIFSIFSFAIKGFYHVKNRLDNMFVVYLSAIISCLFMLLSSLTWDALNNPTIRIIFWLLIGVVISLSRTDQCEYKPK